MPWHSKKKKKKQESDGSASAEFVRRLRELRTKLVEPTSVTGRLAEKSALEARSSKGPSATLKFWHAKKYMGQTGPFWRVTGVSGVGESEMIQIAGKIVSGIQDGAKVPDAKTFNAQLAKIEEALKKGGNVKTQAGKSMADPEWNELNAQWVGDEPMKESMQVKELIGRLYEMKQGLVEGTVIKQVPKTLKTNGDYTRAMMNAIKTYGADDPNAVIAFVERLLERCPFKSGKMVYSNDMAQVAETPNGKKIVDGIMQAAKESDAEKDQKQADWLKSMGVK